MLARAIDVLFILHADHEQNCSTTAMRVVGSSHADPYSACAAACAALYGPLHGGANEAVMRMLTEIGSIENVPAFIQSVKEGHGRLQGFGHRVYKNYDPRAKIIRKIAYDVFEVTGKNPLLDIALKLEEVALADEYFISPQAVPERRLLLRAHLPGHGLPGRDVPGAVRHPAHRGLAGALGRDARAGHEDRPAAPALHGQPGAATASRWRGRAILVSSSASRASVRASPPSAGSRTSPGTSCGKPEGLVDEPGVEVDVRVELARDEVLVVEGGLLELEGDVE